MLSGEETISIDSIITGSAVKYLSAKSREELERQDSIMRYEIDSKDKSEGDQKQKSATLEGMHIFNPYNGVVINGLLSSFAVKSESCWISEYTARTL